MLISVQVCILMCYTGKEPKMEFKISDTATISCPDITAIKNDDDDCDMCGFCLKFFISGVLLLSAKAALAFMILPRTLSSVRCSETHSYSNRRIPLQMSLLHHQFLLLA